MQGGQHHRGAPATCPCAAIPVSAACSCCPAEESLHAFLRRRLGRELFEHLIEPLMAGIHAGNALHGVGIPDAIREGENATEAILAGHGR
ncbi:MAG: hypothetical protein WBA46_10150 [Thermomicrobiales bacterium]